MFINIKTKPNRNGNTYGVKVDTYNKTYVSGYGLSEFADFHATKKEIDLFIKYNLDLAGFVKVDRS